MGSKQFFSKINEFLTRLSAEHEVGGQAGVGTAGPACRRRDSSTGLFCSPRAWHGSAFSSAEWGHFLYRPHRVTVQIKVTDDIKGSTMLCTVSGSISDSCGFVILDGHREETARLSRFFPFRLPLGSICFLLSRSVCFSREHFVSSSSGHG